MKLLLLETEFLIAPLRYFKNDRARGFFAQELVEQYGLTPKELKQMSRSRVFKWTWRSYKGKPSHFYTLR